MQKNFLIIYHRKIFFFQCSVQIRLNSNASQTKGAIFMRWPGRYFPAYFTRDMILSFTLYSTICTIELTQSWIFFFRQNSSPTPTLIKNKWSLPNHHQTRPKIFIRLIPKFRIYISEYQNAVKKNMSQPYEPI